MPVRMPDRDGATLAEAERASASVGKGMRKETSSEKLFVRGGEREIAFVG